MATLPLRFKMEHIRTFEKKNGPLLKVINTLGSFVDTPKDGEDIQVEEGFFELDLNGLIVDFVVAGNLGCDVSRAMEIIDDFYDAGGDIKQALEQIIEGLRKGFFPRK